MRATRPTVLLTLEFDTVSDDPSVRVRIIHGHATVRFDRTIGASELLEP